MADATREVLERQEFWLRHNGLPLVVPPRRRLAGLVTRTVPLLLTFALLAIALLIADAAITGDEQLYLDEVLQQPKVIAALVTAAIVALLAIPVGLLYARIQRRFSQRVRVIVGLVVIVVWLLGLSIAGALMKASGAFQIQIGERVAMLVLAAVISFLEIDHILSWAGRRSFREITSAIPAVARILPLLLLTVLLVFFTNELWQLAATMDKARMWALGLFLAAMILVIIVPATIDMLDDEDTDADHEDLLCDTPFCAIEPTRSRKSVGEWINLVAVASAVQLVQVALFVVLTFGIFALFGSIALTPKLIQTWTGATPSPMVWIGVKLPMDAAMFRVCLILSLFSGISFAASTLSDEKYRSMFLGGIASEVRRNLAARHRYRTTLRRAGKLPTRWATIID